MLQTIRDRLSGPIIWVVIALIAVPFAFWGIQSFRDGGADPTVAEIGSVKITQSQFRRSYDQQYQQLAQYLGENFHPDQIDLPRLRKNVLDGMVQDAAMRTLARDSGFRTDDARVFEQLREIPAFQKDGQFSPQAYREALSRQGRSAASFESLIRDQLVNEQIRQNVLGSAFVPSVEAMTEAQIQDEKRNIVYVRIDPAPFLSAQTVSDEQAKAQYDAHQDQYQAPERVKLAYVELALDRLPKPAPPSPEVLKTLYDSEKASRFSTPEERHARHILVQFGADHEAAHKKAEELAAKLKAGADFAQLARENSDDTGSKASGGDLGWVRHGAMVPAFESALFALQKAGDISEPVETPYGWHLIKLEGVHAAEVKAFDDADVQKQLTEVYAQRDLARQYRDAAEKIEQLAFENASSLEPVAKALGLTVQTTDWLTRSAGSGIASNPAVLSAAFSPEVLNDGENSKPLQIKSEDLVVVRKLDHEAAHVRSYDEVAAQIHEELKKQAADAKAQQAADALVAAVGKGEALDAAAKAAGFNVTSLIDAQRTQKDVDTAILKEAFALARPAEGTVSVGQTKLDGGILSVVAVSAVHAPEVKAEDPSLRSAQSALRSRVAGAEFEAYRKALQQRLGVKILSDQPES